MKCLSTLIMMLFATLVLHIKTVEGSSGSRVRNIFQFTLYAKSIGLSFSYNVSDTETEFEFIYHPKKSKRIITWHPTLVTIPTNRNGEPGGVTSKKLKDRGGRKDSFTIASDRLIPPTEFRRS